MIVRALLFLLFLTTTATAGPLGWPPEAGDMHRTSTICPAAETVEALHQAWAAEYPDRNEMAVLLEDGRCVTAPGAEGLFIVEILSVAPERYAHVDGDTGYVLEVRDGDSNLEGYSFGHISPRNLSLGRP